MKVNGRIYRLCSMDGYAIGTTDNSVTVCDVGMGVLFPDIIKGMKKGDKRKITIELKLIKPKKKGTK